MKTCDILIQNARVMTDYETILERADIVIKDSGISRLHARIIREGEMYFIKDMNSTNGTWINDRRISVYELCPIKNGDVIKLAKSCFELIDTAV